MPGVSSIGLPAGAARAWWVGCCLLAVLLLGCSSSDGGGDGGPDVVVDAGDSTSGGDDATGDVFEVTPTAVRGRVALPLGMATSAADLLVLTGLGEASVGADGSFEVTVGGAGDSMALVFDGDDNLVLMGFVDPAEERVVVDAQSTAVAMVWFAFHLYGLPAEVRVEMLRLVEEHPEVERLAEGLAEQLAEDPAALMEEDEFLVARLESVMNSITRFPLEDELGTERGGAESGDDANNANIIAEPSEPQSGVLVGPNLAGNGMQVTNLSRRTAWYFVYRTGYETDDGAEVEVSPPELVGDGFVQSTNGLTGTVGTLYQAFTNGLDFGPRGLADPIELNVPAGQRRVFFEAVVAGAHIPFWSGTPLWFDDDDPLHQKWQTRAELMTTVSFVRDVLFPAIFSLVLPVKGAVQGASDLPTWESLAHLVTSQVPAVTSQIADGDFSGALQTTLLAMANNAELRNGVALVVVELAKDELAGSADKVLDKIVRANFFVAAADMAVAAADISLVVGDLKEADGLERWDVTAIRAKVLLDAQRTLLAPGRLDSRLTAVVPGAGPTDYFCYEWTLSGPGELSAFLEGPDTGSAKTAVTAEPDMLYLVEEKSLVDGPLALITVKAYRRADNDEACTAPPSGELVGEGRVAIESQTEELEKCKPEDFDVSYWQQEAGTMSLSASGVYGGTITAKVSIPEDEEISGGYRDVSIYIPRPVDPSREGVTLSGDIHHIQSVREETWIQDINRDEAAGPLIFYNVADVRLFAVGDITVSMGTREAPADCGTDDPKSQPCCPRWSYHADWGDVFVGPLVFAKVNGAGRSVDLIQSN